MTTTVRLGLAFCTTRVPADAHELIKVTAVRYAPSRGFAELSDESLPITGNIDYLLGEDGDIVLGARPAEQAVIEIEGE